MGQIDGIPKLIAYTCSQLQGDRHSSDHARKTFCIIVDDYEGSMGFATDPPLLFADKEDPTQMTFWNPQNHPTSFSVDVLLVCQLLAQDCSPHEYVEDRNNRRLIIPQGLHFSSDLLPQIIIPCNHVTPYCDP